MISNCSKNPKHRGEVLYFLKKLTPSKTTE